MPAPKGNKNALGNNGGRPSIIYALCCPRTDKVLYVGKAIDPTERLKQHLRDCCRSTSPKDLWIVSLRQQGLQPKMRVLMETYDWENDERAMISMYGINNLLNSASGGVPTWIDQNKSGMTLHGKLMQRFKSLCLNDLADGYRVMRKAALKQGLGPEYEAHLATTFGSALL